MAGIRSGSTPPRDHDVATFDRRAGSYERDWRSEFHTRVVATAAEVALAALGQRSRVWLARAVAERLPFRDASFDLVVTTVSFAHWTDQPAGLTEIARVLRPAGRLVLVDLFAIGWLRPLTALGRRRDRIHPIAELEAMLTQARLTPLAWERVYDLGPLPLVRAVIAGHWAQPLAASG
jgi:SAM-dependent methyltransferase